MLDRWLAAGLDPAQVAIVCAGLLPVSLLCMLAAGAAWWLGVLYVAIYGAANGGLPYGGGLPQSLDGTGNLLANGIVGNALNNHLSGLAGNDTIAGGAGDDTLDGGTGNDSLAGGAGNDTYVIDSDADVVIEAPGGGFDLISSATLTSSAGFVNIEGLIYTGSTGVALDNGAANTSADYFGGGSGNDTLRGYGGNDTLDGGAGNDTMHGGSGNDMMSGGEGNDIVRGGAGNDYIMADAGNDKLYGGKGFDTVDYSWSLGSVPGQMYAILAGACPNTLAGVEAAYAGGTQIPVGTAPTSSSFGLDVGTDLSSPLHQCMIVANCSGACAYQLFEVTFN